MMDMRVRGMTIAEAMIVAEVLCKRQIAGSGVFRVVESAVHGKLELGIWKVTRK